MADSAIGWIMSLFKYTNSESKKSLEFFIEVDDITKEKFLELTHWIKNNVPSTERFTPEWKSDDDVGGFVLNHSIPVGQQAPSISMNSTMDKVRFRFKHEEHAMAFKLLI